MEIERCLNCGVPSYRKGFCHACSERMKRIWKLLDKCGVCNGTGKLKGDKGDIECLCTERGQYDGR